MWILILCPASLSHNVIEIRGVRMRLCEYQLPCGTKAHYTAPVWILLTTIKITSTCTYSYKLYWYFSIQCFRLLHFWILHRVIIIILYSYCVGSYLCILGWWFMVAWFLMGGKVISIVDVEFQGYWIWNIECVYFIIYVIHKNHETVIDSRTACLIFCSCDEHQYEGDAIQLLAA